MKQLAIALTLLCAPAALSQEAAPRDTRGTAGAPRVQETPRWQFWVKGAGHLYENFFQASGDGEEDVTALRAEAGASLALAPETRLYGSVNALRFDDAALDSARGARIGVARTGEPHAFDVFADFATDRPTFDVGDEFDTATVQTLAGEYAYRFAEDWQVSVDGEAQRQRYELTRSRDNRFSGAGAAVRWRGDRRFSPEVGLRFGTRDVDEPNESYGQREAYLQIRSSLTPRVYLSLRFRDRLRDYSSVSPAASNFGREDVRRQVALTSVFSITRQFSVDLYAAKEDVDSSRAGRDFDTALWALGFTWKF